MLFAGWGVEVVEELTLRQSASFGFIFFLHRWLGITSVGVVEKMGCSNLPLSSKQKDVCKRKPYLLPSIKDGARLGISECQSQFRHERWNCSTSKQPSVFGYELNSGEDRHTDTHSFSFNDFTRTGN